MVVSEFAFLALGLVLGVAGGAALVLVLGSRPPVREVRLTVSHDAVPRRSATLSSDAFMTAPAEPARGGPADRRLLDRVSVPETAATSAWGLAAAVPQVLGQAWSGSRTPVLSPAGSTAPVSVGIFPERDPALDALRIEAAHLAARLNGADPGSGTALMAMRPEHPSRAAAAAPPFIPRSPDGPAGHDEGRPPSPDDEASRGASDDTPALTRILRGDNHALLATAAALGGDDPDDRRRWETTLRSVVQAIVARAIARGCLDFPVGNAFWDTFTIEQCRGIAEALASTGHRFDGIDGWVDGRIPSYRDLTSAVAAIGVEPRRIRAWPTQDEIGELYREVTAAADEHQMAHAPNLEREEFLALIGEGDPDRDRIWSDWERARKHLLGPIVTT